MLTCHGSLQSSSSFYSQSLMAFKESIRREDIPLFTSTYYLLSVKDRWLVYAKVQRAHFILFLELLRGKRPKMIVKIWDEMGELREEVPAQIAKLIENAMPYCRITKKPIDTLKQSVETKESKISSSIPARDLDQVEGELGRQALNISHATYIEFLRQARDSAELQMLLSLLTLKNAKILKDCKHLKDISPKLKSQLFSLIDSVGALENDCTNLNLIARSSLMAVSQCYMSCTDRKKRCLILRSMSYKQKAFLGRVFFPGAPHAKAIYYKEPVIRVYTDHLKNYLLDFEEDLQKELASSLELLPGVLVRLILVYLKLDPASSPSE